MILMMLSNPQFSWWNCNFDHVQILCAVSTLEGWLNDGNFYARFMYIEHSYEHDADMKEND